MRPSPAFLHRLRALEDEFRRADPDAGSVQFNMWFTEAHMLDLASGYVPADVRAAMLAALDWAEEDKRRAARPIQTARRKGSKR